MTDVLLLSDVFENFRTTAMNAYGLDPAQYLTLPGFSLDACLKFSKVKLQLLTDPELHSFFDSNIRGGISVISHRLAEADIEDLPVFDTEKPSSYIMNFDANNLYALPKVRNFQ